MTLFIITEPQLTLNQKTLYYFSGVLVGWENQQVNLSSKLC